MHRLFFAAVGLSVLALIAGGLWLAGGPQAARHEAFDRHRMEDLNRIVRFLECRQRQDADATLPADLAEIWRDGGCRGDRAELPSDPETGAPYSYERLGDHAYRLCAGFHDAENPNLSVLTALHDGSLDFDRQTGCLSGQTD